MLRRAALRLLGGATGIGIIGQAGGSDPDRPVESRATQEDWERLKIRNVTDEVCRTEVWVDGDVLVDVEGGVRRAGRDSAIDGKIVSVTDPRGTDNFLVDGDIERIEWDCDRPPRMSLDGHEFDPRDFSDGYDDDDDDEDDDDDSLSRLLLTSWDDDAEFRVRFTGRSRGRRDGQRRTFSANETIRLEVRRRTEFQYEGRLAELQLRGDVDVVIDQNDDDRDDWWRVD